MSMPTYLVHAHTKKKKKGRKKATKETKLNPAILAWQIVTGTVNK